MSNTVIHNPIQGNSLPPLRDPHKATLRSDKISDEHLQRMAIVYVRQSTQQQVLEHRESTARQYALVDRAGALGWPTAAVCVIDEDQGQSGTRADIRGSVYWKLPTRRACAWRSRWASNFSRV